jgi:hypothetical protein
MKKPPTTLYVNWKDHSSGRWFVVARLIQYQDERGPLYEFAYVNGVREAEKRGFLPFVAFSRLDEVVRSRELLPFFGNRLMNHNRPDYAGYVAQLGLEQDAEAFSLLARSGGRRATERSETEIFAPPHLRDDGVCETHFFLRGIGRIPNADRIASELEEGARLLCRIERDNPVNSKAVVLTNDRHSIVGYLPDYLCDDVAALLETGVEVQVKVARINSIHTALSNRVLCMLTAKVPRNFRPFSGAMFKPLSPEATPLAA